MTLHFWYRSYCSLYTLSFIQLNLLLKFQNYFNMKQDNPTTQATTEQEGQNYNGKLKRASEIPGDEYACNILDENGYWIAQAKINVYNDNDTAEANAARIVKCWNEYDGLKEQNEDLKVKLFQATANYTDKEEKHEKENEQLKEARSESMQHIANLNGDVTELKAMALKEMEINATLKADNERLKEQFNESVEGSSKIIAAYIKTGGELLASNKELIEALTVALHYRKQTHHGDDFVINKLEKAIQKHSK